MSYHLFGFRRGGGDGRGLGVGVGRVIVLLLIAPRVPTAVPLFGSGKETPQRPSATPPSSLFHVVPPSVVLRTVSPKPTAVPLFALAKETAVRVKPSGIWLAHM